MKKRKSAKKSATKKQSKKKSVAKNKRAASTASKRKGTRAKATRAKKASRKSTAAKTTRTAAQRKKPPASSKTRTGSGRPADPREFSRGEVASNRAGQSGDIQGLSSRAGADSESVEELVDEGNAFEADAIEGVERAGDSTREVRTRQVPEDDVPGEYLDED
jgi:hypothetical protein